MNRSMLSYPLARGSDADPGGAADLQTDVMRFMAILSLCLVAIFALVQSIPVADVPVVAAAQPARAIPPAPEPEPSPAEPPQPMPQPVAQPVPVPVERPLPAREAVATPPPPAEPEVEEPLARVPEQPVSTTPARSTSTTKQGFTLRFESDTALTALVAKNEVGLYAIRGDDARRLSIERGRLEFWTASLPSRFHEMDAPTVPAAVRRALRGSDAAARDLRWGVTLPASMSRQLSGYLESRDGGELVIGADGRLRLQ